MIAANPVVILMTFLALCASANAQDAKLIDAAKKEGGKIVAYGPLESETVDAIAKLFTQKTGIKVEYWRASATKVMDRTLAEHRAGKLQADVVLANASPMEIMKKEGVFVKYDSPQYQGFPKEALDKDGIIGPSYRATPYGFVYNTQMIKPEEAPKSFQDLLNPKWREKIAIPDPTQHTTTTQWLANLHAILGGPEQADKIIRGLAAQKPLFVESFTPAAEVVASGEKPIGLAILKHVLIFSQKGAPMDYNRFPLWLGDGNPIAIAAKAPRPNAARVFLDFFLGDEGMKIMADTGEFVTRKGFFPPIKDADKVKWYDMKELSIDELAKKKVEYQKIFLAK